MLEFPATPRHRAGWTVLLVLCAATLLAPPRSARAEHPAEGKWSIAKGRLVDGTPYSGKVDIRKRRDVFQVDWDTDSGKYSGVGILNTQGKLVVGWGQGGNYGVVSYKVTDDGRTLKGPWTFSAAEGQTGTETAVQSSASGQSRVYDTIGTQPGSGSGYKAKLTVTQRGDVYLLRWKSGAETYSGVGVRDGDSLDVGWGYGKQLGVVRYEFGGDGKGAAGMWAIPASENTGTEDLRRR